VEAVAITQNTSFQKAHGPKGKECKKSSKKDILHDTPVRYAGYCDDIGATVRVLCKNSSSKLVKNIPTLSYIPAGLYIAADVASTYAKTNKYEGKKQARKKALSQAVFQGLTSLLFPVLIVGGAQKIAGKGFDKFIPALKQQFDANGAKIANRARDIALALTGLGTLLALSKPTDKLTDKVLMGKIVNPALGLNTPKAGMQGKSHSKLKTTQG